MEMESKQNHWICTRLVGIGWNFTKVLLVRVYGQFSAVWKFSQQIGNKKKNKEIKKQTNKKTNNSN
jgi:hypothetical protein